MTFAIPGANGSDEISDMARAVEVFRTNMISAERLAVEQETTQAAHRAGRKQWIATLSLLATQSPVS